MSLSGSWVTLPRRVTVSELLSSRYVDGVRPQSWDERKDGFDSIRTTEGELITLFSSGQQTPPHHGWVILLRDAAEENSFTWTLYGMPKGVEVQTAH